MRSSRFLGPVLLLVVLGLTGACASHTRFQPDAVDVRTDLGVDVLHHRNGRRVDRDVGEMLRELLGSGRHQRAV